LKYLILLLLFATPAFGSNLLEDRILSTAIADVKIYGRASINTLKTEDMGDFAYLVGKEFNLGETLRAVVYLESKFGTSGRVGDHGKARGVTQIQIPTAKFILKELLKVETRFSDNEIKLLLTYNDKVCIILSKHYLRYLMDRFKNHKANWSHAVLSYNRGPTIVTSHGLNHDPNDYVKKAKQFIAQERKDLFTSTM